MIKTYYSELMFSIDLIRDAYRTNDLKTIKNKLRNDLFIKSSEKEIAECIDYTKNYEKNNKTLQMKQIFN
jgi:hypothetical protein